jgi:hypothetical protein
MSDRLDDLVGDVDDPREQERLRRVHELLLSVDPPPEVPSTLLATPAVEPEPEPEPVAALSRWRPRLVALAATLAAVAFGAGYWVGDREQDPVLVIEMTGTGDRRDAVASIEVLEDDKAGNWPMNVILRGLEPSRDRQDYYELWLTRNGELVDSCGRFLVNPGVTKVVLTVPYGLRRYDGWVVTRAGSDRALLTT